MIVALLAAACLVWYLFILVVCTIGIFQIRRNNTTKPGPCVSIGLALPNVPHVTIIRPIKGIEPQLYDCLSSTFRQTYPATKLTVFFCISSRDDPSLPILERLLRDFPAYDAHILVEEEDPNLSGRHGREQNLGPNPKIRNMSRAYREAKGDIVWIIDCNVWVDISVAGRLVDLLCGFEQNRPGRKYKFVHQLPLAVDLSKPSGDEADYLIDGGLAGQLQDEQTPSTHTYLGGRLEEMFLSTSHAKFYTAISTVAVAPCIVGKSNMFRRSHLNAITASSSYRDPGIDYFSENICEDHLIGDLLWKQPVPESVRIQAEQEGGMSSPSSGHHMPIREWGNHGLLSHSYAIQPMRSFSLRSYLARRTRWLRVRKFTVLLATLVEPGTESFLCSAHGAFGLTTLPWCNETLGIPRTWSTFGLLWLLSVCVWCLVDSKVWSMLQESGTGSPAEEVPGWIKRRQRRGWKEWISAWVCRETFALPIWLWAVLGGLTVSWRGRRFWVGMDLKVHEIDGKGSESREDMGLSSSLERDSSKGKTD